MKISVVGGSGFVGKNLIQDLLKKGHELTNIDISENGFLNKKVKHISTDTTIPGEWQEEIKKSDTIINLAGVTIFNYWSKIYKELIYKSRILTTKNIVDAIDDSVETTLINTSAAGYYGDRQDTLLTEKEIHGNDFLAMVCAQWENEAVKAELKKTRVCIMRFGIVLGNGGALLKMIPMTKLMINPVFGSGSNFFPWIHINDLCNAAVYLMENKELEGAFNFTSPEFTTQKEFTYALASKLNKWVLLHIPKFFIKTFGGELGKSFLCSQKASPEKLMEKGYKFSYENIDQALENIILKSH